MAKLIPDFVSLNPGYLLAETVPISANNFSLIFRPASNLRRST